MRLRAHWVGQPSDRDAVGPEQLDVGLIVQALPVAHERWIGAALDEDVLWTDRVLLECARHLLHLIHEVLERFVHAVSTVKFGLVFRGHSGNCWQGRLRGPRGRFQLWRQLARCCRFGHLAWRCRTASGGHLGPWPRTRTTSLA